MLWYRNRQVPGRQDTMLVADSGGAHVSKEPDVAKMDLIAADIADNTSSATSTTKEGPG